MPNLGTMIGNFITAHPVWAVVIGLMLAGGVAEGARAFLRRLKWNATESLSWVGYAKGQGLILSLFLFGGVGFALVGFGLGPTRGGISERVVRLSFDSLELSGPAYRDLSTAKYSRITMLARTLSPVGGAATVTVYAEKGSGGSVASEVRRLRTTTDSWVRWDQNISGDHMSIVAAPTDEPNVPKATAVQVLVYLTPRPSAR